MINDMNFPLLMGDLTNVASRERDSALSVMGEEEFRAFYERTARPLWAYLSRIADRQRADDYLQEAYYRFYRAGRQYESEAHRRNSLFQIATNVVRDAARRARHYEEVPIAADETASGPEVKSNTPSPERQVEMRNDVARALVGVMLVRCWGSMPTVPWLRDS